MAAGSNYTMLFPTSQPNYPSQDPHEANYNYKISDQSQVSSLLSNLPQFLMKSKLKASSPTISLNPQSKIFTAKVSARCPPKKIPLVRLLSSGSAKQSPIGKLAKAKVYGLGKDSFEKKVQDALDQVQAHNIELHPSFCLFGRCTLS